MERAEEPALDAADGSSRNPISVAILAAMACLPIVIAIGFLADRSEGSPAAAVPGDISVLALRGGLDAPADRRPAMPARAGF